MLHNTKMVDVNKLTGNNGLAFKHLPTQSV